MIKRQDIVDEARTWLETPFHHQGRLKGVGVDCIGLVAETAKALGVAVADQTDYSHQPDGHRLVAALQDHCDAIPVDEALPGDILVFRFVNEPQHVGIVTDRGIIHCVAVNRKVVEHGLDTTWLKRRVAAFHIKGVE